jgi:hypothetical protein
VRADVSRLVDAVPVAVVLVVLVVGLVAEFLVTG